MHVLVVDDEAPARDRLTRLLATIEAVDRISEAKGGVQAVALIEQMRPDLVLLDIQMPVLDGFGVVEALENPPPIIFVTAHDEYAIRAFEVNALDYLLKPFACERLERAIHRAQEARADEWSFTSRLAPMLQSLASHGQHLTRLAVRDRSRIRVLTADEVDWIGIKNEQTVVHAGGKAYPIRRTLAELEARLDPGRFFRSHRSAIVNLDRVREIIPWFKGSHRLRLTTGEEIDLSRAQARALRRTLGW
jgi:DNA-binding LytR/AlgR family response regulator